MRVRTSARKISAALAVGQEFNHNHGPPVSAEERNSIIAAFAEGLDDGLLDDY